MNNKNVKCSLIIAIIFFQISFVAKVHARASASREFLMSCTYGVLGGALVGAATLALENNPEGKVDRIAKGASLGLYSGILLGAYVAYVLPNHLEKKTLKIKEVDSREIYLDESEAPADIEDFDPEKYEFDDGYEYEEIDDSRLQRYMPKLVIHPVFENRKVSGAGVQLHFSL